MTAFPQLATAGAAAGGVDIGVFGVMTGMDGVILEVAVEDDGVAETKVDFEDVLGDIGEEGEIEEEFLVVGVGGMIVIVGC